MAASLEAFLGVDGSTVRVTDRGPARSPHWERFERASRGWLRVAYEPSGAPRAIEIRGSGPHGRILLVGDVEQRQLGPLAETLRALATGKVDADTPATAGRLGDLPGPVALSVYVSPACPFCPSVASAALRLAALSPRVDVTVVRIDQGEVPADVRAVPTVLLAGSVVATGSIGEYDLAERVVSEALRRR